MDSLHFATLAEISAEIRGKKVSPVEVVDAYLQRIEALQPKLNAFVHIDAEGARREARLAAGARGRGTAATGPLFGVPLTVKSCIDVAGWTCPAGSRLRKDYVAAADATLVTRLRGAGAILLGNTNTPEFLMHYEANNLVSGATSNPWNVAYSSGGSSGGEAAAIAGGCSAGGVGSDGGGSIRVPAHFCGIAALKPTPGRIPSTGHFPPGGGAFPWLGVVGPMGRTVADVRALFEVLAGPDGADAIASPIEPGKFPQRQLSGLRVGLLESAALGTVTNETKEAVHRAAELLTEHQFKVEPLRLDGLEQALELWWFFFGPMVAHLYSGVIAGHEAELSPMFREYFSVAHLKVPPTLDKFLEACVQRDQVRASLIKQMKDVPVLLSPVCSAAAFRHGGGNWQPETGYRETMRHSQWLNLAGFPGAVVPMGVFGAEKLPVGVQIIGRPNEDELVLAVAEALEEARGKWEPPPNV